MRSLIVLIAAGLVWACGPAPPLMVTLPGHGIADPLPVTVDDPTGFVRTMAPNGPGDLGTREDGPVAVPGRPTAAVVSWTGGACDVRATITVRPTTDRIEITVATQATFGCESLGVLRRVTLEFIEPIGERDLFGVAESP